MGAGPMDLCADLSATKLDCLVLLGSLCPHWSATTLGPLLLQDLFPLRGKGAMTPGPVLLHGPSPHLSTMGPGTTGLTHLFSLTGAPWCLGPVFLQGF